MGQAGRDIPLLFFESFLFQLAFVCSAMKVRVTYTSGNTSPFSWKIGRFKIALFGLSYA